VIFQSLYEEFMREYLALGHMFSAMEIPTNSTQCLCYLLHHKVMSSIPTVKIRTVFNGSLFRHLEWLLDSEFIAGSFATSSLHNGQYWKVSTDYRSSWGQRLPERKQLTHSKNTTYVAHLTWLSGSLDNSLTTRVITLLTNTVLYYRYNRTARKICTNDFLLLLNNLN